MRTILILILIIVSGTFSFGQHKFYVIPNGDDAGDGLTSPWRTIQYSLNQLSEGDTLVLVRGINYEAFNEKITIPIDNITLTGPDYTSTAPFPVIDATGITGQDPIIHIGNRNNIKIQGIELKNNIQNNAQGILVDGSCSNITVERCVVHDIHFSSDPNAPVSELTNAQGIIVLGTNAVSPITNLKLINNSVGNCRLGYSEGIAVNGNVDGFIISGNYVFDLTNIGIDAIGHEGTSSSAASDQARNGLITGNRVNNCTSPYATSGGIYVDGAKNILIERNFCWKNGYGIEVGCEHTGTTTDSIVVRNNFFYKNETAGIAIGGFDYPSGSGKVTNSIIRNNTCVENDSTNSGLGELYLSYSENTTIENNIFYTNEQGNLAYAELGQPLLNFDYNNVYYPDGNDNLLVDWNGVSYSGFLDFSTGSATNDHSVFGDPMFKFNYDPWYWPFNYHISALSSAHNTGNPSYTYNDLERDFDGEARMEEGRIDCGADEYGTSVGVIENIKNLISIYPNPATTSIHIQSDFPIEKVEVYNLTGEKMISGTGNQSIDILKLNAGLYFVRVYSGNSVSVEKFEKR